MLIFRTMPIKSECESCPVWSSKTDNREAQFGSFLGKTGLDGLLQFFNVLPGDISMLGPCPGRPVHAGQYEDKIRNYN